MACIDFSFDSRIRKKYVPLINQQRYFRHVKRIAARNLSIPQPLLRSHFDDDDLELEKEINLDHEIDEYEKDAIIYSKLNIFFYFTIHHSSLPDCIRCENKESNANYRSCDCDKLIYRSEYITGTNPSWKGFEGSSLCSPSISQFTIRIYFVQINRYPQNQSITDHFSNEANFPINTIENREDDGVLFLEWNVDLTGLLYIGEEFPKDRRLTKNSIIFGLAEGFYTSICSVASEGLLNHSMPPSESLQITDPSLVRNSYEINTLIRIQMVQCIARATANKAKSERMSLKEEFENLKQKHRLISQIEKMQSSIDFLKKVVERRRQKLKDSQRKIYEIDEKISECNMNMSSKIQVLKEEFHILNEFKTIKLAETSRKLERILHSLAHHRRLLARKFFQDIYKIVPFPDGIGYSINSICLPSALKCDQQQQKVISIGLGYVAHLVHHLSQVLDIYLFHPILLLGSRSSIIDLFNKVLKPDEKIVPLYSKSKSNTIFFKHGWHLLNRLIVFIRQSMGLTTRDLAITLNNLYSLYLERFLPDENFVFEDDSLNKFSTYSPSVDVKNRDSGSSNVDYENQKLRCDINELKIHEHMLDYLWKEVEQMTLNSVKNELTSVQHSSLADEIKEIIIKQRNQAKAQNAERISQLTSSLTFSQASSSFDLLTPNVSSSVISTSSPQAILKHQRRSSATQYSMSSDGTAFNNEYCPSPFRVNGICNFQQLSSIKRIRSVSGYSHSPQSLPSNHSFLFPRNVSQPISNDSPISVSLDKGLNLVNQNQENSIHNSNCDSASNLLNSNECIPFPNVELLSHPFKDDIQKDSLIQESTTCNVIFTSSFPESSQ